MCNCPSDITKLGCITPCETRIKTGITVVTGGTYTVKFLHNGVSKSFEFEVSEGEELIVPNHFNENKITQFTITDPAGQDLNKCFEINIQ